MKWLAFIKSSARILRRRAPLTVIAYSFAGLFREAESGATSGSFTVSKRSWIVDLESFSVLASDEDEAIEEGYKYIRQIGVKMDQVLQDPFGPEYDDSGNIIASRNRGTRDTS